MILIILTFSSMFSQEQDMRFDLQDKINPVHPVNPVKNRRLNFYDKGRDLIESSWSSKSDPEIPANKRMAQRAYSDWKIQEGG